MNEFCKEITCRLNLEAVALVLVMIGCFLLILRSFQ